MKKLFLAGLLLALACRSESGDRSAATVETPRTDRPDVPETVEESLGCRNAFLAGPVVLRGSAVKVEGAAEPSRWPPRFLDDCEPVGWTAGCEIEFGSQFCMNRHWTIICSSDAHCPQGSRCTDGAIVGEVDREYSDYGWCAPTCNSELEDACVRPDMDCSTNLDVCMRIDLPRANVEAHVVSPVVTKVRQKRIVIEQRYRPPVKRPSAR